MSFKLRTLLILVFTVSVIVLTAALSMAIGQKSSQKVQEEIGRSLALKGRFIGDVHDAVLLAKPLPNPTGEPLQFMDISESVKDSNGKTLGVLAAHLSRETERLSEKWPKRSFGVSANPLSSITTR